MFTHFYGRAYVELPNVFQYNKSMHHESDVTKADIILSRLGALKNLVNVLEHQIEGMKNTSCGLTCNGCGERLETEWDFANHFRVTDTDFLNLGWCPNDLAKFPR